MRRAIVSLALALLVSSAPLQGAAHESPIVVAPGGRYLQKDGRAFLIIGHNDALTWPGLSPLLDRSDPRAAEEYLHKLKIKGLNTLRVMIEYAQFDGGLLENPLGTYRPAVVAFWDTFFQWLEKYDLYAIVTPWDPFWMERNWARNPYNSQNGGLVPDMKGFLTNPATVAAQKDRYRFLIDRWGGSRHLLAWELLNEVDLWWGANPDEISRWIEMMAGFIRGYQREKYGFNSLVTISSAAPMPSGRLDEVIYNHPSLDFATTHLYTGPGMNAPLNTTDAAEEVALAVTYAGMTIKDKRPYTDTESGPIDAWIGSPKFDAEYLHNISWAHLASGGAGTGMRWPYRNPHILTDEMLDVLGGISRFAAAFDFTGFAPDNITGDLRTDPKCRIYGIADRRRALLWILRDSLAQGKVRPAAVAWKAIPAGAYRVSYWDTWRHEWLRRETRTLSGRTTWRTPSFARDIAIVLEKQ